MAVSSTNASLSITSDGRAGGGRDEVAVEVGLYGETFTVIVNHASFAHALLRGGTVRGYATGTLRTIEDARAAADMDAEGSDDDE